MCHPSNITIFVAKIVKMQIVVNFRIIFEFKKKIANEFEKS